MLKFTSDCPMLVVYSLWSPPNHAPIKSRGPIKKTSHLKPIYLKWNMDIWRRTWSPTRTFNTYRVQVALSTITIEQALGGQTPFMFLFHPSTSRPSLRYNKPGNIFHNLSLMERSVKQICKPSVSTYAIWKGLSYHEYFGGFQFGQADIYPLHGTMNLIISLM